MTLKAAWQKSNTKTVTYKARPLDELRPSPVQFIQLFGNIWANLFFADFDEIVSSFIYGTMNQIPLCQDLSRDLDGGIEMI